MVKLRRGLLATGAALLTLLPMAACASAPPTLVPGLSDSPPDPAKGISGSGLPVRGGTVSIEMLTFLCSVRDVHLTSVQLYHPRGGIQLARWGIENNHITLLGNTDGPLAQLGPFTSHDITRRCHHSPWYSRVGVELHRTQPGPASFLGLRVTYDSDGRQKVAYLWEHDKIHNPSKGA